LNKKIHLAILPGLDKTCLIQIYLVNFKKELQNFWKKLHNSHLQV